MPTKREFTLAELQLLKQNGPQMPIIPSEDRAIIRPVIEEIKRRWRIFYRFWCGGLSYWLFGYFYPTIGNHRWVYEDGHCKRTCSRCGTHEWLMTKPFPAVGEPASSWSKMNHDELRWL